MTIPSSVLIREIMLYEGFCASPKLNKLGMPCIGYGFPLWEDALSVLHGNSKLAKLVKNALPKECENVSAGMARLLQIPFSVNEEQAKKLLEQSLLHYAQELSKRQAGFRHLVNLCGDAFILPESGLARYETHLCIQGDTFWGMGKYAASRKKTGKSEKNIRNGAAAKTEHAWADASETSLHPAFLAASYSDSATFALEKSGFLENTGNYAGGSSSRKSKKKGSKSFYVPLTAPEQALLRADAVLFLTHILGLEIVSEMQGFFWALQAENYALAGSELLAHGSASYLGAVMSMLARRIKEASLDFRDMTVSAEEPVHFLLHRRKAKHYMVRYLQNKGGQKNKQAEKEQRIFAGACHA